MVRGAVRWFSDEAGEGCIVPDGGGEDLFACLTGVAPSRDPTFEIPREGARVVCELVAGKTALPAENVRRIG